MFYIVNGREKLFMMKFHLENVLLKENFRFKIYIIVTIIATTYKIKVKNEFCFTFIGRYILLKDVHSPGKHQWHD